MAVTIGSVTEGNANAEEIKNNSPDSELYENNKKYLQGSLVKFNDKIYLAKRNVPSDVDLDNPYYWEIFMDAADSKRVDELFEKTGNLDELETESKDNLVAAINEVAKCQADYEQNDETKPDFIKGRTHWIEENIEELYSNDSLNVASIEEWNFDTGIPELGCNKEIIYEIEWNGTLYKCVCNSYTYYGRTWYWYGNGSLGAPYSEFSTDSGEPFLITDTGSLISNQIGTHSISIKSFSTVYHTLDPAYLSNVESALSENSQKILNASYNDFIFKQNVSYVRDNELAQKELVNSKYYSSLNFTKHSIFAIITPKDSTYRDKTGTLYLKCKTSGSNTVNITPIKTDGSSITVDDLPTGCAILGKGFADELYLLNPKENTRGTDYEKLTNLPQINGVELLGNKTSKELGIESGTDISLGLTSASVGQTIKVKAIDESGKPTAWEAAEMAGGESSFPKFEKLLTHTITEEEIAANPAAFIWGTAQIPNLNDFNVFTLTIRNPDDTTKITFTKWVRLKINNVLMGNICGTSQGEGYKYSISANRLYGFWVSDNMYNPNNDDTNVLTPPYSRQGFDSNLAASEAVTSIGFTSYVGDYGLTAGIIVEIWGAK